MKTKSVVVDTALKTGQSVKVKNGILCPDDPEFDLSGWRGRIFDINKDEDTIGIAWDSMTLMNDMPERFVEKSESDGLSWAEMYLSHSEVEPAKPRDSEDDTDKAMKKLKKRFKWLSLGKEGKRIQKVVNSAKSDDEMDIMDSWSRHLERILSFPFESVVYEYQSKGIFKQGDKLKVVGIELVDDLYGIIISCKAGRKKYAFPLADLAAVEKKSDNARHIEDYRVWFANR